MRRSLLVAGIFTVSLSLAACDSAEKEKAKLAEIQRHADDKIAQVERDAKERITAAENKVNELQGALADAGAQAKAEAQEEISKVKEEADKLANEATAALAKARAAYKESARQTFTTILKEGEDLHAKAAKAPPKIKPQIDQGLKDIAAKKEAVTKDITALDSATLETLKAAKAKVDQHLAALKQAIHALHQKLSSA